MDDICNQTFLMHYLKKKWFPGEIAWNCVSETLVCEKSLVWVMAWCLIGDNPQSEPMMTKFFEAYIYLHTSVS